MATIVIIRTSYIYSFCLQPRSKQDSDADVIVSAFFALFIKLSRVLCRYTHYGKSSASSTSWHSCLFPCYYSPYTPLTIPPVKIISGFNFSTPNSHYDNETHIRCYVDDTCYDYSERDYKEENYPESVRYLPLSQILTE